MGCSLQRSYVGVLCFIVSSAATAQKPVAIDREELNQVLSPPHIVGYLVPVAEQAASIAGWRQRRDPLRNVVLVGDGFGPSDNLRILGAAVNTSFVGFMRPMAAPDNWMVAAQPTDACPSPPGADFSRVP